VRVLFVTQSDPAGSVHRLARILRQQGVAQARVVMLSEPRREDPACDLARLHDGGQELRELLRSADVVHMVDLVPSLVPLVGEIVGARGDAPRWVLQWNRVPFRSELREVDALASSAEVRTIATRPGLVAQPDAFLPPVIPTYRAPWTPVLPGTRARTRRGIATIFASAPGSVRDDSRLDALIDGAEFVAERCDLRRVEVLAGRPHLQVLRRQRRAHMVLTATDRGLPTIALEALAQGLKVVVDGPADDLAHYAALAGGTPAPVLTPVEMPSAILQLDPHADPDGGARAWAKCVLDPRRWLGACLRLYGSKDAAAA
jgi:hypothetical protein